MGIRCVGFASVAFVLPLSFFLSYDLYLMFYYIYSIYFFDMDGKRFVLDRERLLFDLYVAFFEARRHKASESYVMAYERNLHTNLVALRDALFERLYCPKPSICFVIHDPKTREIFAADFEDRIVHHLYYDYTHEMYERTFIHDTYSCIKGRGTHYGVDRLSMHIRQESQNYTEDCYVLQVDISGYFVNINRNILYDECVGTIGKMAKRRIHRSSPVTWEKRVDIDFVLYLTRAIVLLDPTKNCVRVCDASEWESVPANKLMANSPDDCGLPIGNLTSQLFSNVFLNIFDQYVKRVLRCKHYGRYVDDSYIVSADREYLLSLVPVIESFLLNRLQLRINKGKTKITNVRHGVKFLGAFVKPWRTYVASSTLKRINVGLDGLRGSSPVRVANALNSYCGVLGHHASRSVRCSLFLKNRWVYDFGYFDAEMRKFQLN